MSDVLSDEKYLRLGGWLQNPSGWWHPPNCLASWPLEEAVRMAQKDEGRGLRLSRQDLALYLIDVGAANDHMDAQRYIETIESV